MNVLVKNAVNTSNLRLPFIYAAWLEYWESKKGELNTSKKYKCPTGCGNASHRSELDGCHVQKVFDMSGKMYIVPLCSSCNHRSDYFYVEEDLLVPAP